MSEQLIFQLMPKVMADVSAIEKNRKNTDQKYNFRGVDDVYAAFHGPLAKHGIFYVPEVLEREVSERQSRSGGILTYTRLLVAYTFFASDGSSIRAVVAGEGMDSSDKSTNKAMSAALKYALLQIFCVPVAEQDDADEETPEPVARVAPKAVKPAPEPTIASPLDAIAQLRLLNQKCGWDDAKLLKWLHRRFSVNAMLGLHDTLASLGEGELAEAIKMFQSHLEGKARAEAA